ncbi:MAG: hypothetical protein QOD72_1160 [Acidimicrobiaceae bacterium]|nr:hypothetical protein [Acidimicrobiaceae bacterium]
MGSQLVEASAPRRADVTDGYAQLGGHVLVRRRRIDHQHPQQDLTALRKVGEGEDEGIVVLHAPDGAQRIGLVDAGDLVVVGRDLATLAPQHSEALIARRGHEPSGEALRLSYPAEVLDEPQPRRLAHIGGVFRSEAQVARHRPHQPGEALDDLVEGALVAVGRLAHQELHRR